MIAPAKRSAELGNEEVLKTMIDSGGPRLRPPVEEDREPTQPAVRYADIVLDFSPDQPRARINGARLRQHPTPVRLTLRLPGTQTPVLVNLDDVTRHKITEIGDRYEEVEFPPEPTHPGSDRSRTSPLTKLQNLVQLQQIIETANTLRQDASAQRWWKTVRPHLARTNQEYEGIFGRLRDQLRTQRDDGIRVVRMLLESRATVLVNLGLRLTELEPGLGAIVQQDLVRLYTDDTLGEELRYRAYQGLQGTPRLRGEDAIADDQ